MKSGFFEKNLVKKSEIRKNLKKIEKIPLCHCCTRCRRGVESLTLGEENRGQKQCPSVLGWIRCSAWKALLLKSSRGFY